MIAMDDGDGTPLLAKALRIRSTRVRWQAKRSPLTTFSLSVHDLFLFYPCVACSASFSRSDVAIELDCLHGQCCGSFLIGLLDLQIRSVLGRTLKELGTLDIMYQPWCIRYLEWEQAQLYELKSRLTHLLPKFHDLVGSTQQFGVRESTTSRVVNEVVVVGNQRLENKIIELTSLTRHLAIREHHISPPESVCDICAFVEHLTKVCPILQETEPNIIVVAAMMDGQQYRQPHGQYSN
ncbi:hypothetical protein CR513_33297, partial [Mucuna pruriens]